MKLFGTATAAKEGGALGRAIAFREYYATLAQASRATRWMRAGPLVREWRWPPRSDKEGGSIPCQSAMVIKRDLHVSAKRRPYGGNTTGN